MRSPCKRYELIGYIYRLDTQYCDHLQLYLRGSPDLVAKVRTANGPDAVSERRHDFFT